MPADSSEVRYQAHPSMLRMRPFSTLLVLALMLAGILVAILGKGLVPALLPEQLNDRVVQVAGIVVFALAALQLLAWWVSTLSDRLKITDDEVLWTHGLMNKQYTEISMGSVRTVRVTQSLLQRLMNAGDITVFTTGDLPELVVRGLPEPNRVRELVKARSGDAAEA
ncbi:MAG: PH domain-containing protein [Chromatiaceae bacterium]